jgi:hypothetical protein
MTSTPASSRWTPTSDAVDRQTCGLSTCFATFAGGPARRGELRHCNRAGPDGGHPHEWNGERWIVAVGKMEHDQR